jgi:hypothetical protein
MRMNGEENSPRHRHLEKVRKKLKRKRERKKLGFVTY